MEEGVSFVNEVRDRFARPLLRLTRAPLILGGSGFSIFPQEWLEECEADYGVVPLENSTQGAVRDAHDLFVESGVLIVAEVYLDVEHALLSNSPLHRITRVYSQDQALAQCRQWLERNLPRARLIDVDSTAHGVQLAGLMANPIFFAGAKLTDFKMVIVGGMAFLLLILLGPLLVFSPRLMRAKRTGLREYGMLASRYISEFDLKWVRGGAAADEQLIGSGDIQSLADLGNSLEVVRTMRIVPITKDAVLGVVLATLVPLGTAPPPAT
jgi:hypothetical protein